MYKVAICDDDSLQVSNLETHISEYLMKSMSNMKLMAITKGTVW